MEITTHPANNASKETTMKATMTFYTDSEAALEAHLTNLFSTNATLVTVTNRNFGLGFANVTVHSPDLDAFCDAFDTTDSVGHATFTASNPERYNGLGN